MNAEPHMAARRAALTVHALGTEDRAWMLAQLQPQQRALIEPLLEELRDLGIHADRRALEQIQVETTSPATAATALARLDRREIRELARLLEREAPEVVRTLLAGDASSWSRSLRKALAPAFALRVSRLPPGPVAGPALHAALAAAVERRLAQRQANAMSGRSWWHAWGSRRRTA